MFKLNFRAKKNIEILLISTGFFLSSQVIFAKILETKKDNASLLLDVKTKQLGLKLPMKSSLDEHGREGMYWKVSYKDAKGLLTEGFVSVLDVKIKLDKSDDNFNDILRNSVQKSRNENDAANVRSRSAVMGVRGLDDTSHSQNAGNVRPNLRMVYSLEEQNISKDAVENIRSQISKEIDLKQKK